MGGEDFAWYLDTVPGALARLGTRRPGGHTFDLHRGDFEPDEAAIAVGVRLLVRRAATPRRLSPSTPERHVPRLVPPVTELVTSDQWARNGRWVDCRPCL